MAGSRSGRYCRCGARLARDNRTANCASCQKKAVSLQAGPPEVPAEFWATAITADALDSWHIGQVIRAYRTHPFHGQRPLAQEQVATWLNLTQTQLSRIENGPPVKDLDKLIAWARTLKVPAHLLWFQLPGAHKQGSSPTRAAEPPRNQAPALHSWGPPAMAPVDGGSDLVTMQAFRSADRQIGGGHLYATVLSYLQHTVGPRLFGATGSGHKQSAFTAASALTEMAGWMAHDAGRDGTAKQHFQRSLDFATLGGDSQLTAHVMGSISHLALHQGEPAEAIHLARQGQAVLTAGPPSPGLTARLLAMEARALAALPAPQPAKCGSTLLRAEQALDEDEEESPSPWISRFDEGSLASEAARSLRHLGQLEAATRQAKRIIELRPSSHARSRAFGQLLLALLLVAQGEPEQACIVAHQALDSTQSLSSYLVAQQLRELANLLQPYRANPPIARFLSTLANALAERSWILTCIDSKEADEAPSPGPTP